LRFAHTEKNRSRETIFDDVASAAHDGIACA